MKIPLWRRIINIVLIFVCFAILVFSLQNSIIFHPYKLSAPPELPKSTGLNWEHHVFKNDKGNNISAVFVRHQNSTESASLPVILFSHGNAGNVTHRFGKMLIIASLPVDIFAFDYRGFGFSEGSPSVEGTINDGLSTLKFLKEKFGIDSDKVILYGESIGTGVSVSLAQRIGWKIAGLVLESGFSSLKARAAVKIPVIGPLILTQNYPSDTLLKEYNGPLLVIHSKADDVNPFSDGEVLFNVCPSKSKYLAAFEKYGHNDPMSEDPGYTKAWSEFLKVLSSS
ncbi:MAG: alpha/beta hydrolase [Candidatus Riflebacteria bacterium]|nr:alpha/beta hydrolase [Candidatus Riflebacteria bacterium]